MVAIKSAVETVFVTPKQAETIYRNAKIKKNMKIKKGKEEKPENTFPSSVISMEDKKKYAKEQIIHLENEIAKYLEEMKKNGVQEKNDTKSSVKKRETTVMKAYQMDLQRIVDTNIANDRNNADMKDMIEKEYHESVPIK